MVSAVGVGCDEFGRRIGLDAVCGIVDAADDTGVTFLETSDSYSIGQAEEMIGAVFEGRRDRFVVATKSVATCAAPTALAVPDATSDGRSLKRLRTDRIDLYQLHFPDAITPARRPTPTCSTTDAPSSTSTTACERRGQVARGPASRRMREIDSLADMAPSRRGCTRSTVGPGGSFPISRGADW
jgi:diketogulonate reductase-like aldo/keto reductase